MAALYPGAWCLLHLKSEISRWLLRWRRSRVWFETPYRGEKILLVALFEKGKLRPDVVALLDAAKAAGLYVLAVNTRRLDSPDALQGKIDCYIERPNFGRDFGSYKSAFLHLFERGWHKTCPRLLMVNDSVYFDRTRLPAFLSAMLADGPEVLGSTENYEIEHHLGSFCIALGGTILANPALRAFWQKFRLSDVRPVVIRRGEMGLSRTLKKCASSESEFAALYDSRRALEAITDDDDLLDFAVRNARSSTHVHWKRVSLGDVAETYMKSHMLNALEYADFEARIDVGGNAVTERTFVNSRKDLGAFLSTMLAPDSALDSDILRQMTIANVLETFMEGSQIHQNAVFLLRMGLPIVKLDGMYRGMFSELDVQRLVSLLGKDEGAVLSRELLNRPYGGKVLFGWKRAAFMRGLI